MKRLLTILIFTAAIPASSYAQGMASLPPAAPKVKSQKEAQAIQAVQAAPDPDTKLQKIDYVLTNFADTEFKNLLLDMAVQTAEQKADPTLADAWAQRDLDNNPNSYMAHLVLADDSATSTKEFDLDKDEKLAKAEKDAKTAIEELKTAAKPMPSVTDEQWTQARKAYTAQGWAILGTIEVKRKNFDAAITDYKTALDQGPNPNIEVRLGDVYQKAGRYDEAISPQTKNVATSLKNVATRMKAASNKPAAPASSAAPAATPQSAPAPEAKP